MTVCIPRGSGFFSCCSVKLSIIVEHINAHSKTPDNLDCSVSFEWYKKPHEPADITYEYFEHYDNINDVEVSFPIRYHHEHQFLNYSVIDYKNISPVVKKYFSPSTNIVNIIEEMEKKYKVDYDNVCVLFYRGNDKVTETKLCEYDDYLNYANLIIKNNPNIVFLIQSDETEFIDLMTEKYPNNSFYFKDEIRHMKKCNSTVDKEMSDKNYEFSKYYLAITLIMSKCKYIICGTGNCSIWIMIFRENNNNVCQYLEGKWHNTMDIDDIEIQN